MSTIQSVIDACDDASIAAGDYRKALRYRWMSHTLNNATIEPDEIAAWVIQMHYADEAALPQLRV